MTIFVIFRKLFHDYNDFCRNHILIINLKLSLTVLIETISPSDQNFDMWLRNKFSKREKITQNKMDSRILSDSLGVIIQKKFIEFYFFTVTFLILNWTTDPSWPATLRLICSVFCSSSAIFYSICKSL